jgi:NAD(P)-dependent dehydrogenase (short-subunit alcohol dehydrogenase family)
LFAVKRLHGKVIVVTGAAQGIGAAIASAMAAEGASVGLTDIDFERAEAVAGSLCSAGFTAVACAHNVSDEASWSQVMYKIERQFGAIDVVVNNAGILMVRAITETSLAAFQALTKVNIDGVFLGIKHGFLAMGRRGGAIINLSSINGTTGASHHIAYGASKAAVIQMTKCASIEAATLGLPIRCNAILPGSIRTPMTEINYGFESSNSLEPRLLGLIPSGRLGLPADIASAAVYLASDDAIYVNGSSLVVDGAVTAGLMMKVEVIAETDH